MYIIISCFIHTLMCFGWISCSLDRTFGAVCILSWVKTVVVCCCRLKIKEERLKKPREELHRKYLRT